MRIIHRHIEKTVLEMLDEHRLAALREEADPNGRYLLTGSANLRTAPELAGAMVGRMGTVTLLPLSVGEYLGGSGNFLERCSAIPPAP